MIQLTKFEQEYLKVLKAQKENGKTPKRPKTSGKVRLYPSAQERDYEKWLYTVFMLPVKSLAHSARDKAKVLLMDSLESLEVRTDVDEEEGIYSIFSAELQQSQTAFLAGNLPIMSAALIGFAEDVKNYSKKQQQKFYAMTIGHAWEEGDVWAQEALKQWQNEQLTLIKSLGDKQIAMVGAIVREGVKTGMHSGAIMEQIERDLAHLSRYKAKLIARDQVGKLYGSLTEMQDKEIGIEYYTWLTSMDERVRGNPTGKNPNAIPSHWIMQNKVCPWNDSTKWHVNGVDVTRDARAPQKHPGMEIACRCTSVPMVEMMFDKLLAQI